MEDKTNTVECVPFIIVADIGKTIEWYERIGFKCTATNLLWEPDCELNWARIEWRGAAFMVGPDERQMPSKSKDSSLWFNVVSIDDVLTHLEKEGIPFDKEDETFYGRKVISFKDMNGFSVAFSSALSRSQQSKN